MADAPAPIFIKAQRHVDRADRDHDARVRGHGLDAADPVGRRYCGPGASSLSTAIPDPGRVAQRPTSRTRASSTRRRQPASRPLTHCCRSRLCAVGWQCDGERQRRSRCISLHTRRDRAGYRAKTRTTTNIPLSSSRPRASRSPVSLNLRPPGKRGVDSCGVLRPAALALTMTED